MTTDLGCMYCTPIVRMRIPLLIFALAGLSCERAAAPGKSSLQVGMLPKLSGIAYFTACRKGAEEAAGELGIDLVYDGPITADAADAQETVSAIAQREVFVG